LSVAFTQIRTGTIEKDCRSESDAEISDSPEEEEADMKIGDKSLDQSLNGTQDIVQNND